MILQPARPRLYASIVLIGALIGCGGQTGPSFSSTVRIGTPTPPPGSTIQTTGVTPGAFIAKDSGRFAVPITVLSDREVSHAQLNVYLLSETGGEYCGQNLPDQPEWGPYRRGEVEELVIRGFQVFRLPCQVTGIRAIFHFRNNPGLLIPPPEAQTLAESTLPVRYLIQ